MEIFGAVLSSTVEIMQLPFVLFGIALSFWDFFIWGIVATVILYIVTEVLK